MEDNNNKILIASNGKNQKIKVIVIRTKRRKTSSIKVIDAKVYISVPKNLKNTEIQTVINDKYNWIAKNVSKQKLTLPKREIRYENGEIFYYLGNKIKLVVKEGSVNKIKLKDNLFFIEYKCLRTKSDFPYVVKQTKKILEEWYKKEALNLFTIKTRIITNKLNLNVNEILVKKYKRTWGKCSYKGNIYYNWKLLQAHEYIIDYVVAHEVCHLIQMNHSKKFWSSVKEIDINYKEKIEWLKNNSNLLEW